MHGHAMLLLALLAPLTYGKVIFSDALRIYGTDRIINGKNTTIDKHPHQVSLRWFVPPVHFCGGSLISEKYVLTAAHCIRHVEYRPLSIQLGATYLDHGGINLKINKNKIKVHPDHNATTRDNDIAIVELPEAVQFTKFIKPIELPDAAEVLEVGTETTVTGWGASHFETPTTNQLQQIQLPTISTERCKNMHKKYNNTVTENMVCTLVEGGGKDACQGDSGGPLVAKSKLFGITSWGEGCALADGPGVFTFVPKYRKWIRDSIGL